MTPRSARPAAAAPTLGEQDLAIARSVLYASLFDYPLTLAQLRQTLIEWTATPSQILAAYHRSDALQAAIEYRDGFFFPRGRHELVAERRRREARSRSFLDRQRRLLSIVCALPFVRMVALSGSVAHLNLEGGGDLDLFIVTRGRHVWSVTVLVVLLARLLGRRRTVCANFVVADSRLALEQQDLFTASQMVHLKPLIGRDLFFDFIEANPFVRRFYPNFQPPGPAQTPRMVWDSASPGLSWRSIVFARLKPTVEWLLASPSRAFEVLCRRAYRSYLTRRAASWQSPEQVRLEDDFLKLHTRSHRQTVLERFERTVEETFKLRT
jgi:hypothetical protein